MKTFIQQGCNKLASNKCSLGAQKKLFFPETFKNLAKHQLLKVIGKAPLYKIQNYCFKVLVFKTSINF